jgi:hypothetical protein
MRARRKIAAVCLAAAATVSGCAASDLIGPGATADYSSMFEDMWTQFDLHYSYFDLRGVDWNAIGARYRPQAAAVTTDVQFANVLGSMLKELQDLHVSLTPTGAGGTVRWYSPYETSEPTVNINAILGKYLTSSFVTTGGHIRGGFVAPGIGYVRMASFSESGWDAEMDDALGRLSGATAMIVDVRDNLGGSKTTATAIAGRFADRERTFGYVRLRNGPKHSDFSADIAETVKPVGAKRFTGPVYVLSNRRCMSSAEDFILAMRVLPQTTVVGDTTAGASGAPLVRELANGWTYTISQWIAYTADHQTFEGVGLIPDVTVKLGRTATDEVIERAVALAQGR